MGTVIDSPYMGLPVPVPLQTPGPEWSVDLNACLALIDSHNHSTGQGVMINPSGLNINSDLTFQNHNITNPRSVRFYENASTLAGVADLGCLYVTNDDLYYNDESGNEIRITQSGSVAGGSGTITGLPSGTASAAYISANGTFQFQQATSTAANLDCASIAIRYPGSYPSPAGDYIQLQAPSSLATGYSITLPALPGQTNVMTLGATGVISSITYDAVGQDMSSVGADAIASSMSTTGVDDIANARTRSVSNTVGVGGIAVSPSCGTFTTTSPSFTSVTNLGVTITTSEGGRPVRVLVIPDGGGSTNLGTRSLSTVFFKWLSNASQLAVFEIDVGTTSTSQVGLVPNLEAVDFPAANSTITYQLQIAAGSSTTSFISGYKAMAYEL